MSFNSSAPLGNGDDPDHLDVTIGYNASSRASQNNFDDSQDAQLVPSATVMGEDMMDDDGEAALFQQLYNETEKKLAALFGGQKQDISPGEEDEPLIHDAEDTDTHMVDAAPEVAPTKTARRNLDDDDYDEYDEEDEEPARPAMTNKHSGSLPSPSKSGSSPAAHGDRSPTKQSDKGKEPASSQDLAKSAEDARKKLEADKQATEDAVKRSLNTVFYTLENDRIAMLEQQRLEESEKLIDAEMDNGNTSGGNGTDGQHHGTLSSANLGASSLTLKHLIARIDMKRELVKASDAELRSLMNEVRKNRSKWASEEQVGQEELYEAAEKVLSELKAMTEYSAPFLTRVNKRDAPDYNLIIKTPMDLGTMTKKLKQLAYKSKAEFVNDLNLIWSNCLKYNADPNHPLRRNAIAMRKEAEKLVPLIPEIVVRPRAEVEAEERRKQNGADDNDSDDPEDEQPLVTRGRKAPGKKRGKASSKSSKTITEKHEDTPGLDQKPNLPVNSVIGNLIHENSDSGFPEALHNGLMTPPVGGTSTPGGHGAGSQADMMELDGPSMNGMSMGLGGDAQDLLESEEYKIWKQVTKKDRALVAKERHKLFKGDKLNIDEPALLRTKAGMRRWTRQHKNLTAGDITAEDGNDGKEAEPARKGETLAEEMEGNVEDPALPDYYDTLSAIPDLNPKQEWVEDADGNLVDKGEYWHMVPKGYFTAPPGRLGEKINANMRQIQETRKICSKIGVVKQMQLQSQMYNNQFQKYNPEPFFETDIAAHVQSEPGPVMAEWTCRAALQRSVGEICYHAGFEELQPSAIDVITDIAADYFQKISRTFNIYRETPKVPATGAAAAAGMQWQERYTNEELIMHTLAESGVSIDELEAYVTEGVDRYGNKLGVMHERMKSHLTDLLRPALVDAGEGGVAAFNDGSDQFVGGDFAEDIDEDFFGFKELGLDKEFGLASLSVPLHLLQSRVHSAHNAGLGTGAPGTVPQQVFEPVVPLPPMTKETVKEQIGLVKNFFLAKLHANGDEPLVEDEDLPVKQRFPKPRLPPTGKITSPRKRPAREMGGLKKKKKVEIVDGGGGGGAEGAKTNGEVGANGTPAKVRASYTAAGRGDERSSGESPIKKRKTARDVKGGEGRDRDREVDGEGETDDGGVVGPISPESIER